MRLERRPCRRSAIFTPFDERELPKGKRFRAATFWHLCKHANFERFTRPVSRLGCFKTCQFNDLQRGLNLCTFESTPLVLLCFI